MDPCLPVDPPFLCGRLPAPCPVVPVALCYRCLSSACVLVPELRELVLRTCCLAVDAFGCAAATKWRLRRCLVMLPRLRGCCYQGNLAPAVGLGCCPRCCLLYTSDAAD